MSAPATTILADERRERARRVFETRPPFTADAPYRRIPRRRVMLHVCKDGTVTWRRAGQPVFNGRAIYFYSVRTEAEAERMALLLCREQYVEHPLLPGRPWYKVNEVVETGLTVRDEDGDECAVLDVDHLPSLTARWDHIYRHLILEEAVR